MRLSTTDIYAFQALAYLGTQPLETWIGSDTISEITGIQRPYLVRILATLSSNDIIVSKKGTGGGYSLSKAAKDINLRDVMRAIDGPVAPLSCVSLKWGKECPEQDRCHARNHIWLRVRDAMLAALAEVTVEDLAVDFERGISYRLCLDHLLSPLA
jgi:Rrf2 family transcriptional regulator, cysteine metabolism repressor